MQADLFKCSFCSESFDLELHTPKILIPCSHCLCLRCLKNIFYVHSPERRQCPNCNVSFLSTMHAPGDFPSDPTILQLLQSRPKIDIIQDTELDSQRASTANHLDEICCHNVRKKLKTGKEVDDELARLQELIISQFTEMRKMLHTSQNGAMLNTSNQRKSISKSTMAEISPDESELIIKEEDDDENEHPLADIVNKFKGVFTEAQKTLNGLSRVSENEVFLTQAVQEESLEEEQIKIEALSQPNSNISHGGGVALNAQITGDEMEEEFDQELEERLRSQYKVIQELKSQIMTMETDSQLELDFSEKGVSDVIFTNLCSEVFWSGIDKNKILYLEVNFSATAISDKQFIMFVINIVNNMENLNSIIIHIAETKISNESIRVLSHQCLKNYHLKSFGLNCSETSIGYEGIRSLDDGLSTSIKTLENIELVLNSNYILEEKFLDILSALGRLKYLKLSFEDSHLSAETIPSVIFCLGSLAKNLESLDLNLNGIEIDDTGLEGFSKAVSSLEKLKHFKLCLGESFISNDFLLVLFQSLSLLAARLEALELDLHSTKFSNTAFKQFCEGALSKMQNIEHLKLNLSDTKITNVSLKNLLLPANKLRSLSLNLSENKIHDSGLQNFKEKNNFKKVKSIDFQIGQTDVTDEALQDFLNHVEKEWNTNEGVPLTSNEAPPEEINHPDKKESHSEQEEEPKPKRETKVVNKEEFDPERVVFAELKKELASHYNLKSKPSKLETARVTRLISNLEPKVFESILTKILTNFLSISKVTAKDIKEWEKLIHARFPFSLATTNVQKSTKDVEKKENDNKSVGAPNISSIVKKPTKSSTKRKQDDMSIERQEDHGKNETKQSEKMNIETKQKNNNVAEKPKNSNTARKQSDLNSERKEDHVNEERKQKHKNTEKKQDHRSTERKQDDSNSERKEDHIPKEKKQNHRSAERKQSNDEDNHSSEVSSKKDPQLSELVLSFRWMKKYAQEISFREKVVEILKSMEARSFSVFYKKLLDFIRQLSKVYKTWKIPPKLKQTTSSLNWWYRWMKGDQEITDLWKNLPYSHN